MWKGKSLLLLKGNMGWWSCLSCYKSFLLEWVLRCFSLFTAYSNSDGGPAVCRKSSTSLCLAIPEDILIQAVNGAVQCAFGLVPGVTTGKRGFGAEA